MKLFLILLSLTMGIELKHCFNDSSVSESESVCIQPKCSTRIRKSKRCLPKFKCTDCLKQFKEIEYVLTTLDPSNVTVVTSSFDQIQNEQAVVAKAAQDNVVVQIEELKAGLQKEVVECVEKELTESFEALGIVIDKEINDQVYSVNTAATTAVNTVLSLITALGTQTGVNIPAAIRTPNSPFQQAVTAAIEQVSTTNTQFVLAAKDSISKESANILSKYIYRIVSWIKETFKSIMQSKVRGVFEILKKQIEDILKAGETSLVTGLVQTNKKIISSVCYLIGLCVEALTGTNVPSLYQVGHNTVVN